MFCGIDFMAIWFFLKESVLILLASLLTTTFSTDFSKVLTKVKFSPENSNALNRFLEQLLIKHENLEWVDKLQTDFKDIRLPNSGIQMRKKILKRNDRRYRKRRKLRPYYYRNYRNNQNFNLGEISHLNLDDYENALTGVLKKEGYKQQKVKQKRYIIETPATTYKYKNHTPFDLLDLSILKPEIKDKNENYLSWINNNLRKEFAKDKSKKQVIIPEDYVEYTERSTNCGTKPTVNIKAEELEELLKVVEPTTKKKPGKKRIWPKNKTLGIMNSKKTELTITKSLDARRKNDLSSKNEFETTTTPILVIVMESLPTEKKLERKSITKPDSKEAPKVKAPVDMISKKAKIQNHPEKNIFLNNPQMEQQIDASPTNANIKSINLNNLLIMTDPYILRFTETTVPNHEQPNNLQKREKIVEEDPASVMSPEEIRKAKIEAKKLMDVDKDFNERNEPDFNKELMKPKNNDYKDIYDYWENLKDKVNEKLKSGKKILRSKRKREIKPKDNKQNSFFSRQLLHYNYDNDYDNRLYSDYDDQENSLRRYPRDMNENYGYQNADDDYFDYRNEQPLERRFYKKRWKKEAKNNKKGMFSKSELRNKINKLKNFFGIGHENNYNENIEDDYPVENMSVDEFTAKNNEFIDDNILNNFSDKPANLDNINKPHDSEIFNTENTFDERNNFDSSTLSQNSLSRTVFETQTDNSFISLDSNKKSEQSNKTPFQLNSKTNTPNSLEQSTPIKIQDNNPNSFGQSTLPTIPTSSQSTTENKNSIKNEWHRNLEISSIIDTTFSNDFSLPEPSKINTETSSTEKLALYDFTTKLKTTTTPLNPLSYSFTYKMNLFDPKSSNDDHLLKKLVNFKEKISKRESNFIKKLLKRYKAKQNTKINPDTLTTVKSTDSLTKPPIDSQTSIDNSLLLNNTKYKKKQTKKYKFRHLPKYHSQWKELLKALPPQIPVAQMHVDELKLNAIKKMQEKNKKTHANIKSRDATDYRADLDEDDYISREDFKNSDSVTLNDDEEPQHSGFIVKHNIENSDDSNNSTKCENKNKPHKNRPDIEAEKNAMKLAGHPKTEDNSKSSSNKKGKFRSGGNKKNKGQVKTTEETTKINSLHTMNTTKDRKIFNDKQDKQLVYTERNVLKHSCQSSTTNKTICSKRTSCQATTKTCSTKLLLTKSSTTAIKCPVKKNSPTETCKTTCSTTCPTTCKATTCPTTSRRTTCPTTIKRTTCPTTCGKTTCPTTCRKTTHKITSCPTTCPAKHKISTCPTTCRTTSCPTTCKTTSCPTTCKTTTCPTTCKTTTCPTTHKVTTCPTTCKTTTCPPTTCKTTTCPPTTCETTTCPTTTCKTTHKSTTCPTTTKKCPTTTCKTTTSKCSNIKATSCKSSCAHFYSTHKFGVRSTPWDKPNNLINKPNRKLIHNSQYFDNKYHKAKFNPDRLPRHLIFPKKKYLHRDMPKNEYQEMKHKNLISRLKRKYFPKENNFLTETKNNHFVRRKKSINLNKDTNIPIYKIYPKRIRYQRYRRRKMKNDEAEDEKQRKVLETIYHHRIQRRRNEPEYVRKSHSYDNTIENNVNLPSSYNSEVKRNLIERTTMDNMNKEDFKGITTSDSALNSDALKGKIPAKVVQDLFMDLNNSKNIKNIIGKALRSPRRDPNNPFPNMKKCGKENSGQQLQRILNDFVKKLDSVKISTGNCVGLDSDTQLFLKIITANIKNLNDLDSEESDVPAQSMILFTENILNPSTSNSNDSTTIKDSKCSLNSCKNNQSSTTSKASALTTTAKTTTSAKTTTTLKSTTATQSTSKKCTATTTANKTKSTKAETAKPASCNGISSSTSICQRTSESSINNSPTIKTCGMNPSATNLSQTNNTLSLTGNCKTIIVSSDPSETESSPTCPYAAKSSATTAKSKSSTTKITKTKATKTTKAKSPTTKAVKVTKTKNTCTEISKPPSCKANCSPIPSGEKIKSKMWGKPLKLKIEIFKLNDNSNFDCGTNTTDRNKNQTETRKKFGAAVKRRIGVKLPQKSPLTTHKVSKLNDVKGTIHKLPLTHQEVTNLLAMFNKLSATERKQNKYIYNYLHTQKLFLERLMLQFKKYNQQRRNTKIRKRQNFLKHQQHVVWVSNDSFGPSDDSKYIKLKKRMINDNQMKNFRSRIKRQNYFRDVMRTRRKPEVTFSKMDEWMNVQNEKHKPQYFNFTF